MSHKSRETMEHAVLFRVPMRVTAVIYLKSGDSYPVCPRCHVSMDREYTRYCDRCGQALSWTGFRAATRISK